MLNEVNSEIYINGPLSKYLDLHNGLIAVEEIVSKNI